MKSHYEKYLDNAMEIFELPRGLMKCSKCKKVETITPLHPRYHFIINQSLAVYCQECWAKTIAKKEKIERKIIKESFGIAITFEERELINKHKK